MVVLSCVHCTWARFACNYMGHRACGGGATGWAAPCLGPSHRSRVQTNASNRLTSTVVPSSTTASKLVTPRSCSSAAVTPAAPVTKHAVSVSQTCKQALSHAPRIVVILPVCSLLRSGL